MAQRNYVKITNGSTRSDRGEAKWEDYSLIIGFYKHDGELVDVIDTEFDYISNGNQEMIQRWIYDNISPSEFEDEEAIRRAEVVSYAKPYNR